MTRAAQGPRLRPDKHEATRRRLLVAALKVVGRHGYAGTSIGRVTRRARVALGTFYSHFPSQQDLFDQLLPHLGEQLLAAIRRRLAGITDTAEREAAGFDTFFEFLGEYPEFYRVLNEAEIFAPRAHAAHLENMLQGYLRAFGQASARGELTGFNQAEFEPVIYMLLGARQYLAMRYPAGAGSTPGHPPAAVRDAYLKVFSGGLLSRVRGGRAPADPVSPAKSVSSGSPVAPAPVRVSGEGLRRVARCAVSPGRFEGAPAGPSLLTAMNGLARALLASGDPDAAMPPGDWVDIHYQSIHPMPGTDPVQLTASLRAEGVLVEVCARDSEQRLLAVCGFRSGAGQSMPMPVVNPPVGHPPVVSPVSEHHDLC